jgi:membrane-associated protease RseP (regulator of RpoE activity)
VEAALAPRDRRAWLPPLLFATTVVSVFGTFLVTWTRIFTESGVLDIHPAALLEAGQFTVAIVAILGSHEFGHYLLARRHGVSTSLPYFIPLPLLGFGTLGAVIRVRDRIPSRNALVDIGAAGPLAGFLVALPFLAWGYAHTSWVVGPALAVGLPGRLSLLGVVRQGWPSGIGDVTIFGDNLLLLGFRQLFLGSPPTPGADALAHPFIVAGWFGTLVTMLNLVPIGQLDAGHLTFALLGRRARTVGRVALGGLAFLVIFLSLSWTPWLLVVGLVVGIRHPDVTRPDEPLSRGRVWLCALTAAVAVLCFLPTPFIVG